MYDDYILLDSDFIPNALTENQNKLKSYKTFNISSIQSINPMKFHE